MENPKKNIDDIRSNLDNDAVSDKEIEVLINNHIEYNVGIKNLDKAYLDICLLDKIEDLKERNRQLDETAHDIYKMFEELDDLVTNIDDTLNAKVDDTLKISIIKKLIGDLYNVQNY